MRKYTCAFIDYLHDICIFLLTVSLFSPLTQCATYFNHQFVLFVQLTLDLGVFVQALLALLSAFFDRALDLFDRTLAEILGDELVL